jgi:hypothetical protein
MILRLKYVFFKRGTNFLKEDLFLSKKRKKKRKP